IKNTGKSAVRDGSDQIAVHLGLARNTISRADASAADYGARRLNPPPLCRQRFPSLFPYVLESLKQRLVQEFIAGNDLAPGERAVAAIEVRSEAAGFPDHQDAGRHVPGRKVALPERVEPPGGDPGKIERSSAKPPQAGNLVLNSRELAAE